VIQSVFILIDCIKIDVNKTRSDHLPRKGGGMKEATSMERTDL
jgi:hypothetical protein